MIAAAVCLAPNRHAVAAIKMIVRYRDVGRCSRAAAFNRNIIVADPNHTMRHSDIARTGRVNTVRVARERIRGVDRHAQRGKTVAAIEHHMKLPGTS